jgi:hypothetical protein
VKALDPLLHHLHRRGGGSWSTFARSVENYDADLDATACARALAEHALVEFDFTGSRDWSVTSVQLVTSTLGVAAWGGTGRHLAATGLQVEIEPRTAWIGRRALSYDHAVRVRKGSEWPNGLTPVQVNDILQALPSTGAMIDAKPMERTPLRHADYLAIRSEERRNPDGGFRRTVLLGDWEPVERVDPGRPGVWRVDRRTHIVTRNHRVFNPSADAALWYGFTQAAERLGFENLAIYHNPDLYVARYPALPPTYVRAMLMAGARESRSLSPERRKFTKVTPAFVQWLSSKLGFQITDVS